MGVRAVKVSTLRALGHNFSLLENCSVLTRPDIAKSGAYFSVTSNSFFCPSGAPYSPENLLQ